MPHLSEGPLEVVLPGQLGKLRLRTRPCLDHDILVVIGLPQAMRNEARPAEETRQGASCEVGAVLVIDIPEGGLDQYPFHVGQLEEHDGVGPLVDSLADQGHEVADSPDMLECVAAAHIVGPEVGIRRAIEILDELDAFGRRAHQPFGTIARIDADAAAGAALAQDGKELALAAADLEHGLSGEVIALDLVIAKLAKEMAKAWREDLCLLIGRRIGLQPRIVQRVADEPAILAEYKFEIAAREAHGFGPAADH